MAHFEPSTFLCLVKCVAERRQTQKPTAERKVSVSNRKKDGDLKISFCIKALKYVHELFARLLQPYFTTMHGSLSHCNNTYKFEK